MDAQTIDTTTLFAIITLTALVVGGVMILFFVFFISKKNNIVNERLKAELDFVVRLHKSELKALRGQMNPHFVHNSINAILYYVQRNEVEITENYLVKFSKLIRLFFEFSRRQFITLEEEQNLLKNYLEIEKLRFEDKLTFDFTMDDALDVEESRIPAMLLQPLVENSINHGIFHASGGGHLHIAFLYIDEATYSVIVEDDGIGYKKASALKTHGSTKVKAHSSDVLKERIELLNLSKEWEVTYQMLDLSDISEKTGTRITLTFKELALA